MTASARTWSAVVLILFVVLQVGGCAPPDAGTGPALAAPSLDPARLERGRALVLLRGLPTLGTSHSIAIVEMDPESDRFGDIVVEYDLPDLKEPLHHLYYSPAGRLYATGLDPACSLAEIGLSRGAAGDPSIDGTTCIDTGGQQVGEDMMWLAVNGRDLMFVTFMAGTGIEQSDGGSVGVFDPRTNELVKVIEARRSTVGPGQPYIMYPHGLSALGDRMVVSSTIHADLATGVGSAVTVIDLNTLTAIETITVQDSSPVGLPSAPVEVLFVRDSIVPGVRPAVLVNTMFGFETFRIGFDPATRKFGVPEKLYDGGAAGTGVPLEFYGTADELFVSHALPGVVKRYSLQALPDLVPSGADIVADAGAHHMIFFESAAGRQLVAVQNNLLNLGNAADADPTDVDFIAKVNTHTVTVHDLETSERVGVVDFKTRYGKGIDNIEALFGSGFVHHH